MASVVEMKSSDSMSVSTRASMTGALKSPVTTEIEINFPQLSDKSQVQQLLTKFRQKSGRSAKDELKSLRKLHEGIDRCDYKACHKALADKANPNAGLKPTSLTPIHRALDRAEKCIESDDKAAATEAIRIVSALVIAGSDLEVRDNEGRSPLIRVAKGEMTDDLASLMIDFGANVNAVDKQKNSALHYAAMSSALPEMRNTELVRILVTNGADISIKNDRGRTPLFTAVLFDHLERAEDLLEHGADVSTTDINDRTPLYTAVIQGYSRMIKLLCASGAYVDIKDKNGQTPLHYAISHGRSEVAETLLAAGADTNLVSKGETPLCRATSKCNLQIIDLLLRHGADVAVPSPNYGGALAIHLAAIGPSAEVLKRLLEAGSPSSAHDDSKRTPAEWAVEAGKHENARLLHAYAAG
ncbi:ankyrin repeat-containing domain protein [Microdochium trichocladiopsis]|uniref:Ankyrin repeat-containing domain protein n=1 Tax=Microdochium trichocladiopsis TaxID=1682393 RepID=A0A9P8XY31_9PEZI|nr:ankyrin repeat-containing domain protein [Microdochium trichocladiopsis]KAH7025755.1 ankyrin repeat-containing domain protein [Microdochium trichocladiopsis]